MKLFGLVIGCPSKIFFHDWEEIGERYFRYKFPDGTIGSIIKSKYICLACGKIWDMIAEEEHKRKVKDKRIKELLNNKT